MAGKSSAVKTSKNKVYINNLIDVSDLHNGCRMALYPCEDSFDLHLDQGGSYRPSRLQRKIWTMWKDEFWGEWIDRVCHKEPFAVVVNGELVDGDHHGTKTLVSNNHNDQRRIAEASMSVPLNHPLFSGHLYVVRGTEAHTGKSAEQDEVIAEKLGAIKDRDGHYTHYELNLRVGGPNGALVNLKHTIGGTSRAAYESSAPMAQLAEMWAEAGKWQERPVDVLLRAHRHRYIKIEVPSARVYTIVAVSPGWQAKTPFSHTLSGASRAQFGGILVRTGDQEFYTRAFVRTIEPPTPIVIEGVETI